MAALLWGAVALTGLGCPRAVRPEVGTDRTVESGVPVDFGAEGKDSPEVTWDFGDGAPSQHGGRVSHAFGRSGTYVVRALDKDTVLASAKLTVVPRPVLRAIPEDAEVAVFFPEVRGNVEPLMTFGARLLGEEQLRQSLGAMPLLSTVLQESRGEARLVNVEEGAGFFALPGFNGSVAMLGVLDAKAAVDALVQEMTSAGATVLKKDAGGGVLLRRPNELPLLVFTDRGYLYLVVPDEPDKEAPETAEGTGGSEPVPVGPPVGPEVLEAVRAHVVGMGPAGLSELPLLTALRSKVGTGNVMLFARPEPKDTSEGFQGAWAALKVTENQAELEGWAASSKALLSGARAPALALDKLPAGPIAALTASMAAGDLSNLFFGTPGSERRDRTLRRLREEQGLDAAGAEALLGALRGDVSLLAYLDASAFYRNLLQGNHKPEPRGTLLLQAGLVRSEPVLTWLTQQLKQRAQPYEQSQEAGATRLRTKLFGQPVEVSVAADRLTVRGGEPLEGRSVQDVGARLRERFGAETFGPGHLSLMADVGQLRSELDASEVAGVPSQQLPMARALVTTFLEQLPPVEGAFLDFAPEQDGGRFRVRMTLRPR